MNDWANFLVAEVTASAALAGLIFVGVSLNLGKIIPSPALPNRALQALVFLMAILILSSLLLVPGQSTALMGLEILGIGIIVLVITLRLDRNSFRKLEPQFRHFIVQNIVFNQITISPYWLTGLAVLTWGAPGLYGLAPIVIFSLLKAVLDAWVLLIEINR